MFAPEVVIRSKFSLSAARSGSGVKAPRRVPQTIEIVAERHSSTSSADSHSTTSRNGQVKELLSTQSSQEGSQERHQKA